MRKFWKYLNNSNVKLAVDLNPFVWSFRYMRMVPTPSDPDLYIWYIRILPLSIILTIDSGKVILLGEDIEVREENDDEKKNPQQILPDYL